MSSCKEPRTLPCVATNTQGFCPHQVPPPRDTASTPSSQMSPGKKGHQGESSQQTDKPTVLKPDPQWVFDCGAYYVIFVAREFTFLITFCEFSFEYAFTELSVTRRRARGRERGTSRTRGHWAQTPGYTQGWVLPTAHTPACPPHVRGTVLNIVFHLVHEDHGPLIMLIFLNEYAGNRPRDATVGAEGFS